MYGRAAAAARAMPVVMDAADPALVQQLQEMGFPEHMARGASRRSDCSLDPRCTCLEIALVLSCRASCNIRFPSWGCAGLAQLACGHLCLGSRHKPLEQLFVCLLVCMCMASRHSWGSLSTCCNCAQARAALRRFGNDVEMACQALLSAGALESEGGVAAAGRAGDEHEHEHVAGTSEDARGEFACGQLPAEVQCHANGLISARVA